MVDDIETVGDAVDEIERLENIHSTLNDYSQRIGEVKSELYSFLLSTGIDSENAETALVNAYSNIQALKERVRNEIECVKLSPLESSRNAR